MLGQMIGDAGRLRCLGRLRSPLSSNQFMSLDPASPYDWLLSLGAQMGTMPNKRPRHMNNYYFLRTTSGLPRPQVILVRCLAYLFLHYPTPW